MIHSFHKLFPWEMNGGSCASGGIGDGYQNGDGDDAWLVVVVSTPSIGNFLNAAPVSIIQL